MKRFLAFSLTIAVMAFVVWASLRRSTPPTGSPGHSFDIGAEARLRELLSSAERGDVSAYLSSFTGSMRARVEREVEERGRDAFAADLRRAAAARKSHAIFAPEPDGPEAVLITVETVYADRNERQTYRLTQRPDGWLVWDVETVRSHTPTAKFGTFAEYQEPEAVPVQGLAAQPALGDNAAVERAPASARPEVSSPIPNPHPPAKE